jgi:hypothetical protein
VRLHPHLTTPLRTSLFLYLYPSCSLSLCSCEKATQEAQQQALELDEKRVSFEQLALVLHR